MIFSSYTPLVLDIPVSITGQPDVWFDVVSVESLPQIVEESVIFIHLRKQIEKPGIYATNIAWLREFYLQRSDGSTLRLNMGNRCHVPGYWDATLGENITNDGHYDSTDESCIYVVRDTIPAGSRIAYRGRAKTSTIEGCMLKVWDRIALTVEVRPQFEVFLEKFDALAEKVDLLYDHLENMTFNITRRGRATSFLAKSRRS